MASLVSVCIPTHRRPEGLDRLLTSLAAQSGAPPFDVIIVDNDSTGSGEQVAARHRHRLALSYLVEPVRGLARVRNRAVACARTRFIAFIDDDEWAPPEWLANLHRVANDFCADVVIGGVEQVFDDKVPDYIKACGLFDNPPRCDGAPVPWYLTRTSNALIRRESLPDLFAPFSTHFDLAGGEDLELFRRMIDHGARVVAANASVFESRPVNRANLRWVLRRALRNGGTFGAVEWGRSDRKTSARRLARAGVEAIRHAAKVVGLWNRDRSGAGRHVVRACEEVGKILHLAGIRIEEYRTHP
jgi:glycosyltransferase involved in cell wall biosynthesis